MAVAMAGAIPRTVTSERATISTYGRNAACSSAPCASMTRSNTASSRASPCAATASRRPVRQSTTVPKRSNVRSRGLLTDGRGALGVVGDDGVDRDRVAEPGAAAEEAELEHERAADRLELEPARDRERGERGAAGREHVVGDQRPRAARREPAVDLDRGGAVLEL